MHFLTDTLPLVQYVSDYTSPYSPFEVKFSTLRNIFWEKGLLSNTLELALKAICKGHGLGMGDMGDVE